MSFFVVFDEDYILYILVEFETDRMSPRESAENGWNGAHGLSCIFFVNSEVIFEIYDKNYPMKKNSSLYDTFEIFAIFEILAIFEVSNGNFGWMAKIIANVFSWFFMRMTSFIFWLNLRVINKFSLKCKNWPKWRSRVKLKNFCQFWVQIQNLRYKIPNEKKFHVSPTI